MRKFISGFLWLMLTSSAWGHGLFVFDNRVAALVNAPVFDAEGTRLRGAEYLAALYIGPTADSLQPAVSSTGFDIIAIQPFQTGVFAGYIEREGVDALNVDNFSLAWVQMRAWDASLGGTYEEAVQAGLGGYGESNLFQTRAGGSTGAGDDRAFLVGLESFSLRPVIPEPCALSLLLLAVPVLWISNRPGR